MTVSTYYGLVSPVYGTPKQYYPRYVASPKRFAKNIWLGIGIGAVIMPRARTRGKARHYGDAKFCWSAKSPYSP